MTLQSAALLLLLVMDPFGNILLYLGALKDVAPERQRRVIARELVIALAVLVFFLFAGQHLLTWLRISEPALTVAGGLLLFVIALRMIFPPAAKSGDDAIEGEPFIVPLAVPFVAGPSAMATVMLIMGQDPGRWREWLGALIAAWLATCLVLLAAPWLRRVLGRRGLLATERLMGMLLITVAVEMVMSGVGTFLQSLR